MNSLSNLFVSPDHTIKKVINSIDENGRGTAIVVDSRNTLLGVITAGDIRRSLHYGQDIYSLASEMMNKNPIVMHVNDLHKKTINKQLLSNIRDKEKSISEDIFSLIIPVVDSKNVVRKIVSYSTKDEKLITIKNSNIRSTRGLKLVLVVGGAGYLGCVLSELLLAHGYKVRVLDILLFGKDHLVKLEENPNFQLIRGDIRDISTLNKALDGADAVIDLAAIVGDPASRKSPVETVEVNYLATTSLAMACKYHQINRFIYASTCSVYGVSKEKATEESPLKPVSLYARTKIESEKGILSLADENFTPIILRMSTLYGLSPRMRFDLVVNTFSKMATTYGKIDVFGGKQWRPLLHVRDAAYAYLLCLEAPISKLKRSNTLVFNVGSDQQNYSIDELANIVKKTIKGTKINILKQEDDVGKIDKRTYQVSFDKIRKTLLFRAKEHIVSAVQEIHKAITHGTIADVEDQRYYNSDNLTKVSQNKPPLPNIIAIIPARGGSKTIPKKNLKPLGGKPLIAWPIELAKSIPAISRVIVSSDDDEILRVARLYGAETPFVRPRSLSDDKTSTLSVLQHAVKYILQKEHKPVDIVLLLYATTPFLKKERILEGIKHLEDAHCDSVLGVKMVKGRVWRYEKKIKRYDPFYPKVSVNRQYFQHLYEEAGNIYFTKAKVLLHKNRLINEQACRFIQIEENESLDIDTLNDFKEAEKILTNKKGTP